MASDRAIRLRRANADGRIAELTSALADHYDVERPKYTVKRSYNAELRNAMNQEQTADLLEAIADRVGVDMIRKHPRRLVPITADPTANESLILTDDPEENERRKNNAEARARSYRVLRGEEKIEQPDVDPPIQRMDTRHPDRYDPKNNPEGAYLLDPAFEPTPDPSTVKEKKSGTKASTKAREKATKAPMMDDSSSEPESGSSTPNPSAEQSGKPVASEPAK